MIKQYKEKPLIIEAVQWTEGNLGEIRKFCGKYMEGCHNLLFIKTMHGYIKCLKGDYIVKYEPNDFRVWSQEYFNKKIDSSEIEETETIFECDELVEVSYDEEHWVKRHYACYKGGEHYCWKVGRDSCTAIDKFDIRAWRFIRRYEPKR